MTEAHCKVAVIGKSCGGRILVMTWRVLLYIGELCDDSQGKFLAACKPPGDNAWVSWFHVHAGPHSRMWQDDGPPIPTDICLRDDLLGVMFGTMIDSKIENAHWKLWGKLVCQSILIQKVCYTLCHGLQHLVQFLDIWWVVRGQTWQKGRCKLMIAKLTLYWGISKGSLSIYYLAVGWPESEDTLTRWCHHPLDLCYCGGRNIDFLHHSGV